MSSTNNYSDGYFRAPAKMVNEGVVHFGFNANVESSESATVLKGFSLRMFGLLDEFGSEHPEIGVTITAEQFLDLIDSMKAEFDRAQSLRKALE